jgi:hypothetical protein
MTKPTLSVVVAVVDGGAALERCLRALKAQQHAPAMEILVPCDPGLTGVESVVARCADGEPFVECVRTGPLDTRRPPSSTLGQHELIDRRRSAGLAAARADLIAMVEDRAVPRVDWAASIVRAHERHACAAIGGAVENARDRLLNWAVYYCDFGRYQLPFAAGPRGYVSDVNVAYKRRALELTREIWRHRYHEPWVHRALALAGEGLFLSPDIVVHECRNDLRLATLVRERFAWGLLFASLRARGTSLPRRLTFAAAAPALPAVLFGRFLRDRRTRRTPVGRVLRVSPIVACLLGVWTAGEAAGYLTPTGWWHHRSFRPPRAIGSARE